MTLMIMKLLVISLSSLLNIATCSNLDSTCELSTNNVLTCGSIPLAIPKGVSSVHIKDFKFEAHVFEINKTHFQATGWINVTHLEFSDEYGDFNENITFRDRALGGLDNLKVFEFHSGGEIRFEPLALLGLDKVTTLDFSECFRLTLEDIAAALNGSDKVPNLEHLLLSSIHYKRLPISIDREFSRCLSSKPLVHLDLSKTRVSVLVLDIFQDLNTLTTFNISGAMITGTTNRGTTPLDLKDIALIDMSYIVVDQGTFKHLDIHNVKSPYVDHLNRIALVLSPDVLNISGVLTSDVRVYNVKTWSEDYIQSNTKYLIMMENMLRRVDIQVDCKNFNLTSIKLLNLAKNGMEYIHPSILDCLSNLEHLDLSDNNLYQMYVENAQLFTELLKSSTNLKYISMASNDLKDIPKDFFAGNELLEVINLAGNRLTQVHFKLNHLHKLQLLNLSKNHIKVIDEISMDNIDAISTIIQYVENTHAEINVSLNENGKHAKVIVDVTLNPLLCDACETINSIWWIVKTKRLVTLSENISCKSESGLEMNVNEEAVRKVQDICDRRTRNIVLVAITALVSVTCLVICSVIYMRQKIRRKQAKRNDIINMLKADEGRFLVFLSYNSDDEDFVTENVIEPLNEGLQRIVDTDRNLVCRGDLEYRPGQQLHDELIRCVEQCTVFLCVISNQYCSSSFCREEFNQALQMKTPVLLMMKDEVDVGMMTPAMKLLFRTNVRILWENNDGEYRLKTSWENVCESILNKAAN